MPDNSITIHGIEIREGDVPATICIAGTHFTTDLLKNFGKSFPDRPDGLIAVDKREEDHTVTIHTFRYAEDALKWFKEHHPDRMRYSPLKDEYGRTVED